MSTTQSYNSPLAVPFLVVTRKASARAILFEILTHTTTLLTLSRTVTVLSVSPIATTVRGGRN